MQINDNKTHFLHLPLDICNFLSSSLSFTKSSAQIAGSSLFSKIRITLEFQVKFLCGGCGGARRSTCNDIRSRMWELLSLWIYCFKCIAYFYHSYRSGGFSRNMAYGVFHWLLNPTWIIKGKCILHECHVFR